MIDPMTTRHALLPTSRADGSITGYAGGLDRKRTLLALEEPSAGERDALF